MKKSRGPRYGGAPKRLARGAGKVPVVHFRRGRKSPRRERRALLAEAPLTIEIRSGAAYTLMRTPGGDRELAVGFLLSEGLIAGLAELLTLEECAESRNLVRVALAATAAPAPRRNLTVNSSCGLCGRADLDSLFAGLRPAGAGPEVPIEVLYALPGRVRAGQALFRATGASHAAALFDAAGRVLALREDLGRHNALDKVLGWALLAGTALAPLGVFLTGRASLEMVAKAARAGLALVAAVSAPTAAAVAAAERANLTLCGFVRGEEVTVYTRPERIRAAPARRGKPKA